MRDLEFSSSERRGNGDPKAPKRILGGKVSFFGFLALKTRHFIRKEEMSKNRTF